MALYTIGDLHLSLAGDKPMDKFGETWQNHPDKLRQGFSALGEEDLTVLCGDLSWAMSMQEAEADFRFIQELPGKKLILKGNHDYWWSTATKAYKFFGEQGFDSLEILHNNAVIWNDVALCGTRGWFYEEDHGTEHDRKMMLREILRLLQDYGVRRCYYGHIHGRGIPLAYNGWVGCTEFRLVSADAVGFVPVRVL